MNNENFYEKAVRDIYEAIAREKTVKTLTARHKESIEGRTSTHEIDIFWEFTDEDITYKTVIQARETTTLAALFAMVRIIRDIPGQTIGVIITQPVYQKDIKDMAASAGIILYELIPPVTQDVVEQVVDNVRINVDKDWVKAEKQRGGLGDEPVQVTNQPKYAFLYDEQGRLLDSVQGIFDSYGKQRELALVGRKQSIVHTFSAPVFLQTNHELVPFVKLTSIDFDLEFMNANELPGEEMVEYILDKVFRFFGG